MGTNGRPTGVAADNLGAPPPGATGDAGEITALRALLNAIVDYAGLFPPAKLAMSPAVENYARYRAGPHAWMLGRFVCSVSRLEEFRSATRLLLPTTPGAEPWRISALADGDLDADLDAVFAFNHEHAIPGNGLALADAVELKPMDASAIDHAIDLVPDELYPFFEIPPAADPRGFAAALAGSEAGAKIRTGGVTDHAIPAADRIAAFIIACASADVPFKATAGLHHPVRSEHALTYEPGSPRAVTHGFLNVFIGAAIARRKGIDAARLTQVIAETEPGAFVIEPTRAGYRGVFVDADELAVTRANFATSFGSCSFEEPIADLQALGLL